jgi:hypothetical protein
MVRSCPVLVAVALLSASPVLPQKAPLAWRVATGLARLGPRPDGGPAQVPAMRFLIGEMQRAGLREVRSVPVAGHPEWVNLTGVLPGRSAREIVLSAHWDSVPRSPGADDDASGCGVAVAAAADLARTPLEHTVRVVLFDAEETGLHGSRGWVESLPPAHRDRILADLNVEMVGWPGSPGPTIHTFPVQARGRRTLAPGWLVHFLLRSGDAVGWPYAVSDAQAPVLAQLVLRTARVRLGADANAFTAHGIPALTVSDTALLTMDPTYHRPSDTPDRLDPARLERWTTAMAAAVRRLDKLSGRPVDEDVYLALFGRVWLRRDLYWVGLALWVLLAFRSRRHLPGLVFRLLFALAVILAPVISVLLFPAALLAAFPPQRRWARALTIFLGLLPLLIYLGSLGAAAVLHLASFKPGVQIWPVLLVLATAAAFVFLLAGRAERTSPV